MVKDLAGAVKPEGHRRAKPSAEKIATTLPKEVSLAAYLVANVTVRDAEKMEAYAAAAGPTLAAHGGELILDGRLAETLSGAWNAPGVALVRFPSVEAAQKWHNSPEYKALAPLRASAADMDIALFASA